jgi:hypothetical protein
VTESRPRALEWSVPDTCDGGSAADAGEDADIDATGDGDAAWDADLGD